MWNRDINYQISSSQSLLQNFNYTANNFITGVSNDYHSYNPSNSRYSAVAPTRSSVFDPQQSFATLKGPGRYSFDQHKLANSNPAANTDYFVSNANRISYLTPSASRPNNYYYGQIHTYSEPTKAAFNNQTSYGLNFYRLSDGNKVAIDQFNNTGLHWLYYNDTGLDNNLLTLSSAGAVSKVEGTTAYQDNTTNPITPLLFQTHGGIGANNTATMVTDYPRDSWTQADDRETYIIYRPSFGANVQIPTNIETMGEWYSNTTGERSGS